MNSLAPQRCHICGLPIDVDRGRRITPLGLSVDHLQPLSLGGGNHKTNLKPAHRYCNNLRGSDEIVPEFRERCRRRLMEEFGPRIADLEKRLVLWEALRTVKVRA